MTAEPTGISRTDLPVRRGIKRKLSSDDDEASGGASSEGISLKKHIDTLAQKNYQGIKGLNTIDTVIMFCPNETAITSLPRKGGAALFDYAMKNKVTLACPSILYYQLKTAEYSWKADKQSKNIADIIKLANLVSDQAVDIYGTAKKAQAAIADTSDKVADVMGKIKDGGNRSF